MAHEQQLEFIRLVSQHINDKTYQGFQILEIGSYDVNGSIRPFFNGSNYVGVDLTPGPGVDLVAEGNKLDLPNEYFDLAISCECFEHNPNWVDTFKNMYRMTKLGGFVIITCATRGRLEHGTTRTNPAASPGTDVSGWNYYKNLNKSDFEKNLSLENKFSKYFFYRNKNSADLYFVGKKLGSDVSLDYQ